MKLTATQESGRLTLALSGELDHHEAKNLIRELEERIDT